MSDHEDIKEETGRYGDLKRRIEKTFWRRSENPEAGAAWERACNDFHSSKSPMRFIESKAGRDRLRAGDPALVEHAIAFLEVDPYVFRSGYAKAAIIRCIKRLPFTSRQVWRLQTVVLRAIDKCDRQEFRSYCRLAAAVYAPDFADLIRGRLDSTDSRIRRRARWCLDFLDNRRRGG